MTSLHGYIIAHRQWDDETKLGMGARTLGLTMGEAWHRHIGFDREKDFPILVQRWNEKGYGPHRVSISLAPEPELQLTDEQKAALRDALAAMEEGK